MLYYLAIGESMAVLLKQIRLVGSKGSEEVTAIFDHGATYSCIQPELALKLGVPETLPEPMEFGTAKQGERIRATEQVMLNFYLDGYRFSDEFTLVAELSEPAIIGATTLEKWRM